MLSTRGRFWAVVNLAFAHQRQRYAQHGVSNGAVPCVVRVKAVDVAEVVIASERCAPTVGDRKAPVHGTVQAITLGVPASWSILSNVT